METDNCFPFFLSVLPFFVSGNWEFFSLLNSSMKQMFLLLLQFNISRGDGRGDGERPAAAVQTPRHPFLLIGLSKLSEVTENHRTHLVWVSEEPQIGVCPRHGALSPWAGLQNHHLRGCDLRTSGPHCASLAKHTDWAERELGPSKRCLEASVWILEMSSNCWLRGHIWGTACAPVTPWKFIY